MTGIMTRWLVLHEYAVEERDRTADGDVTDEAVQRWVDAAWTAYLEHCPVLGRRRERAGLVLRHRTGRLPCGAELGRPTEVVVTASATEIQPSSFAISVRLRPVGGERELPVDVTCRLRLEDEATGEAQELGTGVRDELIALEHSATRFN
ncbi:hypothetical protein [Plantactinospora sp. CA-290183]|uniref:hypothetical protein n=1 Tax=Plantactinospora sp. CA-290183 TaxID=3240006 RepID=UPI003D8D79BD